MVASSGSGGRRPGAGRPKGSVNKPKPGMKRAVDVVKATVENNLHKAGLAPRDLGFDSLEQQRVIAKQLMALAAQEVAKLREKDPKRPFKPRDYKDYLLAASLVLDRITPYEY